MRTTGTKAFILLVVVTFLGDAVNCDILIAQGVNAVFHAGWNPITREVVAGKGSLSLDASHRSIASTLNPAQDEDSPTTLDTGFPEVHDVRPAPELPRVPTLPGTVSHTYLSLCTLLL